MNEPFKKGHSFPIGLYLKGRGKFVGYEFELHCNHQVTPYVLPQIDSKKIYVNEDSLQNSLQNDYNMITTFGSLQQSKWEKFMFSDIDMTTSANLGILECSFYCSHLTSNKF